MAVKVFKTSILVFKDRDRYVSGEFRFRTGYSKSNPRKMVKLWAEKEMRNLKRCVQMGHLSCPYFSIYLVISHTNSCTLTDNLRARMICSYV